MTHPFSKARRSVQPITPTRRSFLTGSAGALVVGIVLVDGSPTLAASEIGTNAAIDPEAFVRIGADNLVTVVIKHLDKGQGVTTGLTTIVAEELDADWAQMRFAFAPADNRRYANLAFGPVQGTGGSSSIANSWHQLRRAGAAARQMLIAAAADEWKVATKDIRIEKGVLMAGANRAPFGTFAAKAALKPVPTDVTPKPSTAYRFIGKEGTTPRLDAVAKTTGKAMYALDVRRPGMLRAVITRPPKFGGKVASFDASAARKVKGVVDVVQVPSGVAVIANDTWAAFKGREALKITWDLAGAEDRSSDDLFAEFRRLSNKRGLVAKRKGNVSAALEKAESVVETVFEFPYLAHAPMEPMNGVIERRPDGVIEAWGGFQMQTVDQAVIAAICGVPSDKVVLNTLLAGGSFGRRALPTADWAAEMAQVLKASGYRAPIQLVYSREDDMTAGHYRPMALHRVRAGIDDKDQIVAWDHRIIAQPIFMATPFEAQIVANGIDHSVVEGAADTVYAFPAHVVEAHNVRSRVPVLWWRSVGHSHSAHAMEVMMDQMATAAGVDPVAFRRPLLKDQPRMAAVLDLVASKSNWGTALPKGQGRGIALHRSFDTDVAMVAEVSVAGKTVKVTRIVAAVDCGIAINPDIVRSQIEGAVGFALSTQRNAVTLAKGEVEQRNFDTFEPTRFTEMPVVEVHIVSSTATPTGIGEPGLPPMLPAIANAVYAATGKRLRSLPFDFDLLDMPDRSDKS